MITPQFQLDLNRELIIDNFAGGGGASTGIELALGRHVDHAINHDWAALGMHRINHPQTVHHCEDVFDVDPIQITEGRPVALGWFSPDCKHFSKAKGGKPLSKKIRGLAFVILRYAKIRLRCIYMENVEEIQTWGPLLPDGQPDKTQRGRTWRAFLAALSTGLDPVSPDMQNILDVLGDSITREELIRGFGYEVQTREIRACDFGAPTIRKRLYLIARCDGQPIVWPEPTHAPASKAKALGLQVWRAISECIDWLIPVFSIFLTRNECKKLGYRCKRPLAKATLRRIAKGIDRYVLRAKRPFMINLTHQGGDRVESVDEPIRTITGAHRGEKALVNTTYAPFISEHANATNQRNFPADEPVRTQCAEVKGGHFSLVAGTMVQTGYGERDGQAPRALDLTKPGGTAVAGGCKQGVVTAGLVNTANGKYDDADSRLVSPESPLPTVTTSGNHAVITASICREFGESIGQSVDNPAPTVMPAGGGKTSIITGTLVGAGGPAYSGKPKSLDVPFNTLTTENHSSLVTGTLVGAGGRAAQSQPRSLDQPNLTGTAKADQCLAVAHLTKFVTGSVGGELTDPAPTITAGSHSPDTHGGAAAPLGIVSANVVKLRGTNVGHAADEPGHTVSAGGTHQGVTMAFLAQNNEGKSNNPGHSAEDPISTISTTGAQQSIITANTVAYYGTEKDGQAMSGPSRTVTAKARMGLSVSEAVSHGLTEEQLAGARRVAAFLREHGVTFEGEFATVQGYIIVDIGLRMLTARELFRAQGFPEGYVIDRAWVVDPATGEVKEVALTKEQQIRMCGNSVCPDVAKALIRTNNPELCLWDIIKQVKIPRRKSQRRRMMKEAA